jgi:hypothetical protein
MYRFVSQILKIQGKSDFGNASAGEMGDLVDLVGIEPTTSSMPWKRAPSCATGPLFGGHDYELPVADNLTHSR